jgi:hypothetical protein
MNINFTIIFRKFLFLIVCLLPFQSLPKTIWTTYLNAEPPFFISAFSLMDEVTFLISFLLLFTFVCLKPDVFRFSLNGLGKWIGLFVIVALMSMAINGVRPAQSLFGIYDVLKNIMFLFVFYMLRFDRHELKSFLNILKYVGFILAVFAVIGELLALFFGVGIGLLVTEEARYGIHRAVSLAGKGNHNYVGIFGVFVFFLIYIKPIKNRLDHATLWLLVLLILFTFSRQALLGLVIMFLMLGTPRTKFFLAFFSIPFLFLSYFLYADQISSILMEDISFDPSQYFRLYAFVVSLKILVEHLFFGLGPGTFGGLASIMFDSKVYANWPPYFKELAFRINGIDQFWPVIWAETGIIGMLAYSAIFFVIYLRLRKAQLFFRSINSLYMYRLGRALMGFQLVLIAMGFAGGLNIAYVIFSYFGLVGIYLFQYHKTLMKCVITSREPIQGKTL